MIYVILLAVHLLVCLLVYLGIQFHMIRVHRYMFLVVFFLPFWGALLVLILHFQILCRTDNGIDVGVEKLRLESELYKSVVVDERKTAQNTVPIEEALIINTRKERRNIIMDVLNDEPGEYVDLLQKAGSNDDTEVVHYAVTAMVEISKENDYQLQDFERQYALEPDNPVVLEQYTDFLWGCLSRNLMQGQVEVLNRELFSVLMQKKIAAGGSVSDYARMVENDLRRKNYALAGEYLRQMNQVWPKREEYYYLRLQYLASLGQGQEIRNLLQEIKESQLFLSAKFKEVLAFWEK